MTAKDCLTCRHKSIRGEWFICHMTGWFLRLDHKTPIPEKPEDGDCRHREKKA